MESNQHCSYAKAKNYLSLSQVSTTATDKILSKEVANKKKIRTEMKGDYKNMAERAKVPGLPKTGMREPAKLQTSCKVMLLSSVYLYSYLGFMRNEKR